MKRESVYRLRTNLGMSQRAFARSIQRSSVSISLHESGRQPLGWKTLERITLLYAKQCRRLGITFEKMMREKAAQTKTARRGRGSSRGKRRRG